MILLQVYSILQAKRDVDTVLTMGIMEDVSIIPQPAGGELNLSFLIIPCRGIFILQLRYYRAR